MTDCAYVVYAIESTATVAGTCALVILIAVIREWFFDDEE